MRLIHAPVFPPLGANLLARLWKAVLGLVQGQEATNPAIGPCLVPNVETRLRNDPPLLRAANNHLVPRGNGLARAAFSTDLAVCAEGIRPDVTRGIIG